MTLTDEQMQRVWEISDIYFGLLKKRIECELTAARAEAEALRKDKDGAYLERNRLVALLSKLFPSGRKKTEIEGWSEDWHGCVYIDFPWGQASWHYHDSHAHLFEHLPPYRGEWNGHTTEEKYAALADPTLRGEIENAAYERAAEACERLISGDGICAADGVWIHDCADAIRALIKEKK